MIKVRAFIALALASTSCAPAPSAPTRPSVTVVPEPGCPMQPPRSKADEKALESLSAKRIAKICVYGVGSGDLVRANGALRSRAGQPLDLIEVQADVRSLMASGRFEDVEVSAIPQGKEALVVFQVRARPLITEVSFEGAEMLRKEGLEPKIAPVEGKPIDVANVYEAAAMIRDEYHRRGYRHMTLSVRSDTTNPSRTPMKIVVVEGKQFAFGPIRLNGSNGVRAAELQKATKLEQGMPFDEEKIAQAVHDIEAFYLDHGFPTARATPTIGETAPDGTIPVVFDIVEGDLVRFGPVTIDSIDGAKLKAPAVKLKSKKGEPFSRAAIDDDVRALVAAFARRGQKVVVVPRRALDPSKRTIDVAFQVAPAPK